MSAVPSDVGVADETADDAQMSGTEDASVPPEDGVQPTNEELIASGEAQRLNEPVEVEALTSETQLVEAMPDGTSRVTINSTPQRVEQNDEWVPVDPTLAIDGEGEFWSPEATTVPVRFYGDGSDTLAQVQMEDGSWLTEVWPLGSLPEPVIDGPHATYTEVLPDVDLRLTATPTGMSEVLVIHTEEAAQDPVLQNLAIEIEGAEITAEAGVLRARPEGTEPSETDLRANEPLMWDSSVEGSDADGPHPSTFPITLETKPVQDEIDLGLSAVAETEDLTYPVFVDPDWTGGKIEAWYIDFFKPNTAYPQWSGDERQMRVGYINASNSWPDYEDHRARSFWWMDTSAVKGKQILAAAFNTTEIWAPTCNARPVQLWRVSNASGDDTWNTALDVVYEQLLSTQNVAHGYNASCPTNTVGFDAKAAIEWTAANNQNSVVLALIAADENDWQAWKRFRFDTSLTITYNTRPDAPTGLSLTSPVRSCGTSGDPEWVSSEIPWTFRGRLYDQDGGNLYALVYLERKVGSSWVNVLDESHYIGPGMAGGYHEVTISPGDDILNLSPGSGHSYTIGGAPERYLVEGDYRWRMRAWDGYANSVVPASPLTCYLRVENDPPATPSVAFPPNGTVYTIGKPFEVSVSAPLETDQPAMYQYYWETNGAQVDPVDPPVEVRGCDRQGAGSTRFACARGANPVLLTVAPISDVGTLWVRTVDEADNVSAWASKQFIAGSDYAGISYAEGHGWMLPTTLTNAIADANTTAPRPLLLGAAGNVDVTTVNPMVGKPVIDPVDVVPISVFKNIDGVYDDAVGIKVGRGNQLLSTPAWVWKANGTTAAPAGKQSLCKSATHASLTLAAAGSSCAIGNPLGYVSTSSTGVSGAVQLRVCTDGTASVTYVKAAACTSPHTQLELLGWGMNSDAIARTALPAVDTTESFSVSAYLAADPDAMPGVPQTALSQASGANSGFELGINGEGKWQFCAFDQRPGSSEVCATSVADASTDWTLVTGVWDKVNQQLRLYLDQDTTPTDVAWRAPTTFEDGVTTGGFTVANSQAREAPANRWFGLVSRPVVFPGVIAHDQRFQLFLEDDLPTGP